MALADVREEWHLFHDDKPGERFRNHHHRMQQKPRWHAVVAVALGVLLQAAGVVLLFTPGPGLLLILFGIALAGSHSKRFSDALDRGEPALREKAHRLAAWWGHLHPTRKVGIIGGGLLLAAIALNGVWTHVVVAHLL
jgi:hypothetical protein